MQLWGVHLQRDVKNERDKPAMKHGDSLLADMTYLYLWEGLLEARAPAAGLRC